MATIAEQTKEDLAKRIKFLEDENERLERENDELETGNKDLHTELHEMPDFDELRGILSPLADPQNWSGRTWNPVLVGIGEDPDLIVNRALEVLP